METNMNTRLIETVRLLLLATVLFVCMALVDETVFLKPPQTPAERPI
jgi:hypothetical protein